MKKQLTLGHGLILGAFCLGFGIVLAFSDHITVEDIAARALDRRAGIQFTDGLVGLFSNSDALLKLCRGAGLLALDLVPFARRFVARRMIYGARGLP